MQITIELLNADTLKLLQQLEHLQLLRLLPFKQETKTNVEPLKKRKWAGSISSQTADAMHQHVEATRNEWERNI